MKRDSQGAVIPDGGICRATGKRMWSSRRRAKLTARRVNPGEHMSAYECESCHWWHIGHMPEAVRSGDVPRDQLVQRTWPKKRP